MGTMEGAMQNYNVRSSGQGGLLFLSNATEYWDMMQLSVSLTLYENGDIRMKVVK